ncbi:hypothetical protein [Macrococcus epidermidis]|uniref:hypothetical protein n=1 Tax=Macrococcus epidermidis TaxID=1902580 RepID=UPI0020B7DAA6|nr:hypothetical protein [Macrococcus epidermidis]UTH16301.1 hypothetical protein KFV12_00525 [Macrococcus epidermidis]
MREQYNVLVSPYMIKEIEPLFCILNDKICKFDNSLLVVKFAHGLGYKLYMKRNIATTYYDYIMTPEESVKFYEMIWDKRFVEFID